MAGIEDEYAVEKFSTATANPAFHDRVLAVLGSGVLMICMPSLAKTASNILVNFESRLRIKNLNCAARSPRSMIRLRAC